MTEHIQRGNETLFYISSPDGLVAMHISDDGDEMKYVLTDYVGTIYALVDDGAQSTDDALYYSLNAWGEGRELQAYDGSSTAPLFADPADYISSRGYTGHEHIDAFDLINMNGRVYDPNTSSFLSPDPVMQSPDNPQNLNRYSYCLNNPTKYIDPSGFTKQKPPRQEWLENNYGFEGGTYFYRGQQFYYNSETGGFNGNMGGYHSGNIASGYSTAGIHHNESSSTGYINRYGEEVPFDYVYDHVIEPNSDNYYGADAINQLRDIAQNSMTMDFPSDFYSSNVSMNGNIYMVTSKNPIGNYRIKYGGIIFPRGCCTHIVGAVIIEGSAGGGESDWVGITNSVSGYVSYAFGIISNTLTSTKAGSDISYFLSNGKAFIYFVKYLKPITYGATGVGMFSDFYLSTTGHQSWTESGINTVVTIGATIVGGCLGIGLQAQYQASKGYMKTISKHPDWVMPSGYHSFTH